LLDVRELSSLVVVSPHADDEVVGAGGVIARAAGSGVAVHVLLMAVDALKHWGLDAETTVEGRVQEIEAVAARLGFSYEIVYTGQDLIERLDTVGQRELVDVLEQAFNRLRPDLLLIPHGDDFDQDHRVVYRAALAAARPIPEDLGKFMPPNVMTYEAPKLAWADAPFRPSFYVDISEQIEDKLDALRLYATQLRRPPHVRSAENLRALAYLRGSDIGVEYAEAFSVLRATSA
jgi:LmbE family N-acetylglucosaminyl deacetylase